MGVPSLLYLIIARACTNGVADKHAVEEIF